MKHSVDFFAKGLSARATVARSSFCQLGFLMIEITNQMFRVQYNSLDVVMGKQYAALSRVLFV